MNIRAAGYVFDANSIISLSANQTIQFVHAQQEERETTPTLYIERWQQLDNLTVSGEDQCLEMIDALYSAARGGRTMFDMEDVAHIENKLNLES